MGWGAASVSCPAGAAIFSFGQDDYRRLTLQTENSFAAMSRSWIPRWHPLAVAVAFVTLLSSATTSVFADSCPNAAFRVGPSAVLPDCRAYEMVTPPFKAGWGVFPGEFSLDGSSVTGASFGNFAGGTANSNLFGNHYLFSRTASGWVSTPLNPPSTQFEAIELASGFGNPDTNGLGATLLVFHRLDQSIYQADLYLREHGGSFVPVGPMLPASAIPPSPTGSSEAVEGESIVGASADLSHVLFSIVSGETFPPGITTNLWPGDTTQVKMESLYEYAGTGNETPALVGVDTGEALISQCGTMLGGSGGNRHNAISSPAGSFVFFTARHEAGCAGIQPPADELFARINQSHTVVISEPTTTDCSTCNTSTPMAANFEGASSDGSRVLFTTKQTLLPLDTDATTDLYMYDFNAPSGQRIIQVSGGGNGDATPGAGANVQGVATLSEDGSHVYFVAQGVLTTDPNSQGKVAQAGQNNLYAYERDARFPTGHTSFVAGLSNSDAGQWEARASGHMQTTDDGRFLVFTSSVDLTPDDTSAAQQVFEYDAQSGNLIRVSIGDREFNENGNTNVDEASVSTPFSNNINQTSHPSVSEDGSKVAFMSADGLTPQALNDAHDSLGNRAYNVYEYHGGRVSLISDGRGGAVLLGMSSSGSDLFFGTEDQLVPQDTDQLADVYDARIGGGFSPPPPPLGCDGEACQGSLSAIPPGQNPGSSSFVGPGNLAPPVSKPVSKPPTRAQKLAKALKACRSKHDKHKRASCKAQARKRYGAKSNSHKGGK
jgi:Tol biopolymer transport system component